MKRAGEASQRALNAAERTRGERSFVSKRPEVAGCEAVEAHE